MHIQPFIFTKVSIKNHVFPIAEFHKFWMQNIQRAKVKDPGHAAGKQWNATWTQAQTFMLVLTAVHHPRENVY